MPNGKGNGGGGFSYKREIDRTTPSEVGEHREAGPVLDVQVPKAQAHAVSMAAARLVAAFVLCIAAMGATAFFGVAFVIGVTTFIWYLVQARKWVDVDAEGNEINCLDLGAIVRGIFLTAFSAFLAWCLWRVVTFVAPPVVVTPGGMAGAREIVTLLMKIGVIVVSMLTVLEVAFARGRGLKFSLAALGIGVILGLVLIYAAFDTRNWSTVQALLKYARGGMALLGLLFLVYGLFSFVHLEVAFGQEMIYRSPFMEQHLFEQGFAWFFGWKKRRPEQPRDPTLVYHGTPPNNGGDGRGKAQEIETALRGILEPETALTPEQQEGRDMMAFLVMGQVMRGKDGKPALYSRRDWSNEVLPTGTVISGEQARRWGTTLSKVGILEDGPQGLDIARHMTLWDAINRISIARNVAPPHPTEWAEWVSNPPQSPTQPPPTQPTQQGGGAEGFEVMVPPEIVLGGDESGEDDCPPHLG